jgi:catechol 2,3-dioxygenase-like lactoylglutathione lyase family enzyme
VTGFAVRPRKSRVCDVTRETRLHRAAFSVQVRDGVTTMITGMHAVIYTRDAEADRAFFRDVLGFSAVDAGDGWLIFAAPPSEIAFHPAEHNGRHEIYLMCDDVGAEIARLGRQGITCSAVSDEGWGLLSTVQLPGGGGLGLYQPRHPLAHRL